MAASRQGRLAQTTPEATLLSRLALALLLTPAAAAQAACFGPGQDLFHCSVAGTKAIDICLQESVAIYRFGPKAGPADMLLAQPVTEVGFTPWPGVSRTIWEEAAFRNGDYRYLVSYSVERDPDGPPPAGRVIVMRGDTEIATVRCDVGTVATYDLYAIFEAKQASGQCWSYDSHDWQPC